MSLSLWGAIVWITFAPALLAIVCRIDDVVVKGGKRESQGTMGEWRMTNGKEEQHSRKERQSERRREGERGGGRENRENRENRESERQAEADGKRTVC